MAYLILSREEGKREAEPRNEKKHGKTPPKGEEEFEHHNKYA